MRALSLLLVLAVPALADELEWETVATDPFTVKSRPRPKSEVREVWAEGDLDAPVRDIQDALTIMKRFSSFMPYVKDAREVSKEDDGSVYTYTELDLPVITGRDYVVHVFQDEGVKADGSGNFRCHWVAAPDVLPLHDDLVRLTVNEGTWEVTPKPGGKSHVIYRFAADPGGLVPVWMINLGNQHGVGDTLGAIEKEAQRRHKARSPH